MGSVIYLTIPLILINATPKLSSEEQQLASLMENFPFPNDRKSILEAMLYMKEKVDFISKEKVDRKTAYWIRRWCAKATQLKQKADILFPNDSIVIETYNKIMTDDKRIKQIIKIKAIIGFIILIAATIFAVVRWSTRNNNVITNGKDYSATLEWQADGLFAKLPQPETTNGFISMETEKQVSFELYKVSRKDFEAYVKACRNIGFTIDVTKTSTTFYADDEEGYNLYVFYDERENVISVIINAYNIETDTEGED